MMQVLVWRVLRKQYRGAGYKLALEGITPGPSNHGVLGAAQPARESRLTRVRVLVRVRV